MTKINIGVLGCSSIAFRQILPAIKASEKLNLVYVASRSEEKGEKFGKQFECKHCSYDELIDASNVEAVYVSLPVSLHYEWGKKIIQRQKHLLMEKPFTDSLQKAFDLIALATTNKLIAMEGLAYVYHPHYKKVLSLIKGGEIGAVKYMNAYFGFPYKPENDIRNNSELGGGAILDNLIYPLSFCLNVAGNMPHAIFGSIRYNKKYSIDEGGDLLIDFGEITANIVYGFGLMYRNSYDIWGANGYLSDERVFSRPGDMPGEITIIKQNEKKLIPVQSANQYLLMLDEFCEKIEGKSNSDANEKTDILNRMEIISRIYEESKEKKQNISFS